MNDAIQVTGLAKTYAADKGQPQLVVVFIGVLALAIIVTGYLFNLIQ